MKKKHEGSKEMNLAVLVSIFSKLEPQVIVSIISIAVSVILVIWQLNRNAKLHLKTALSDKRPLIIASVYPNMDFGCTQKKRSNFTRYIAKTLIYKYEESRTAKQQNYTFLRIRNESDNHAHNVEIKFSYKRKNCTSTLKHPYTINIIASFTEYMFILPLPENISYLDEYKIDITYYSIAGEKINYCCSYINDSENKAVNIYKGTYPKCIIFKTKTFKLSVFADIIETIEIDKSQAKRSILIKKNLKNEVR